MIDKLVEKIRKTEAPIVVGLDPMLDYIPDVLKKKVFDETGETLEGAGEAVWQFNKAIIDATCDLIPAVKPQIAMYEQFGIEGMKAFQRTVDYAKSKDLVVIGDVKRGDIGSTSAAYATAHLGRVMVGDREYALFDEDFATVNPYLGTDGVLPFLRVCADQDKGIFVLVKTSNPSSGEFQDRLTISEKKGDGPIAFFVAGKGKKNLTPEEFVEGLFEGKETKKALQVRPLYELVAEEVNEWAQSPELLGQSGYSEVGAVVGATYPEVGKVLRKVMPKSYILVPGYGAQGGKGKDLVHFFNKDGLGAIVNSSRGIIAAWKNEAYADKYDPEDFADASRAAVKAMRKDIQEALG